MENICEFRKTYIERAWMVGKRINACLQADEEGTVVVREKEMHVTTAYYNMWVSS